MTSILVADDDPILREIAAEYLRDAGFSVDLAEDGEEALRAAERGRYDLVVTDMVMPNLDGIELLRALRASCPGTPVIAISAGIAGENADLLLRAAKAVGAVSVLPKPLVRAVFLEHVRAAIAAR